MSITIHHESHTDHVSREVLEYVLAQTERERADDLGKGTVIHTVHLPPPLPPVLCGLIGPATGFGKVPEAFVRYEARPGRRNVSRVIAHALCPSREVTVIVGEYQGDPRVLFTVFGGPQSPKEPTDPYLTEEERAESEAFWSEHALADGTSDADA